MSRPLGALRNARGLTLLELMVVIAIMGLATAGVSLAMRDTAGERLEREAERLAALLEAGRAASRTSGVPVRWQPTAAPPPPPFLQKAGWCCTQVA